MDFDLGMFVAVYLSGGYCRISFPPCRLAARSAISTGKISPVMVKYFGELYLQPGSTRVEPNWRIES